MKIIFLDIDGVINSIAHSNYIKKYKEETGKDYVEEGGNRFVDPFAVMRVIRICNKTGAKVVVSSSWRSFTLKDTKEDFMTYRDLAPLVPYIVGITPRMRSRIRGEEIQIWLNGYDEQIKYIIIDDDCDMLESQMPFFVKTDYMEGGLTDEIADKCIEMLGKINQEVNNV